MKPLPSAESQLASLDKILDRWRATEHRTEFYRQIAIAEIKKLGHSEGDASRWLSGAAKKPARPKVPT